MTLRRPCALVAIGLCGKPALARQESGLLRTPSRDPGCRRASRADTTAARFDPVSTGNGEATKIIAGGRPTIVAPQEEV